MFTGSLALDLLLGDVHSLKEKRSVVRPVVAELRRKFELPVHLWDERLTSAEANRILRSTELSIGKRTGAVDRMAAVLILQSFLAARASG